MCRFTLTHAPLGRQRDPRMQGHARAAAGVPRDRHRAWHEAAAAGAAASATGAAGAAVWASAKDPAVSKPKPRAMDTSSFFILSTLFF